MKTKTELLFTKTFDIEIPHIRDESADFVKLSKQSLFSTELNRTQLTSVSHVASSLFINIIAFV